MNNKYSKYWSLLSIVIILIIVIRVVDFKSIGIFCDDKKKLDSFIGNKDNVKALLSDIKEFKNEYVKDSTFIIQKWSKLSRFYTSKHTYIPDRKIGFYDQVDELDSITRALFFNRFYDYNIEKIKVVDSIYSIELDYVYTCRNTYVIDYVYRDSLFSLLRIR